MRLPALAALCALTAAATAQTSSLQTKAKALLSEPYAARAHWGISVVSLEGKPLYSLHAGELFRPASTAKLFTTAAALERLPGALESPGATSVSGAAPDAQGTVLGDLLLVGTGDANLSGRAVPYKSPPEPKASPSADEDPLAGIDELASAVSARGVRHITGGIQAFGVGPTEPFPQGWAQEDALWGFSAPISLLAVNDNELEAVARSGAKAGDPVTVTLRPDVGELTLKVEATTVAAGAQAALAWERLPGSRVVRVFGTMAQDAPPDIEHLAVADPARFAALALKSRLEARGVAVDGDVQPQPAPPQDTRSFRTASLQPLPKRTYGMAAQGDSGPGTFCVSRKGAPLLDDITVTLKDSLNLHAEMLLRRIGWEEDVYELATMEHRSFAIEGARAVRDTLLHAGLDPDDFTFYDGSGLSDKDVVTPRATTTLLTWASHRPWFPGWKAALPLGGVDGTLIHRFTEAPLRAHVFAKTGTLGESQALAGFVQCASGHTVAFSIFADTHLPGHSETATIDKLVAAIAAAF